MSASVSLDDIGLHEISEDKNTDDKDERMKQAMRMKAQQYPNHAIEEILKMIEAKENEVKEEEKETKEVQGHVSFHNVEDEFSEEIERLTKSISNLRNTFEKPSIGDPQKIHSEHADVLHSSQEVGKHLEGKHLDEDAITPAEEVLMTEIEIENMHKVDTYKQNKQAEHILPSEASFSKEEARQDEEEEEAATRAGGTKGEADKTRNDLIATLAFSIVTGGTDEEAAKQRKDRIATLAFDIVTRGIFRSIEPTSSSNQSEKEKQKVEKASTLFEKYSRPDYVKLKQLEEMDNARKQKAKADRERWDLASKKAYMKREKIMSSVEVETAVEKQRQKETQVSVALKNIVVETVLRRLHVAQETDRVAQERTNALNEFQAQKRKQAQIAQEQIEAKKLKQSQMAQEQQRKQKMQEDERTLQLEKTKLAKEKQAFEVKKQKIKENQLEKRVLEKTTSAFAGVRPPIHHERKEKYSEGAKPTIQQKQTEQKKELITKTFKLILKKLQKRKE